MVMDPFANYEAHIDILRAKVDELTEMLVSMYMLVKAHNDTDDQYSMNQLHIPRNIISWWCDYQKDVMLRQESERKAKEVIRQQALAKLTDEEKSALGVL